MPAVMQRRILERKGEGVAIWVLLSLSVLFLWRSFLSLDRLFGNLSLVL